MTRQFYLSDEFLTRLKRVGQKKKKKKEPAPDTLMVLAGVSLSHGTWKSDLRSCLTGGGHVTEGAVLNNGPIEGFQLASLMAQSASLPVGITGLRPRPTLQAVNVNRFTAASSRC